jgi:phytoene synthase
MRDSIADPDRALSLVYAPPDLRLVLAVLWRLDEALAQIVRTTTEPLVGRMRLTWWHEQLVALDDRPAPAEPLLSDIATLLKPHLPPSTLVPLIDGWEILLDEFPISADTIADYAEARGATLFKAAAMLLGGAHGLPVAVAGRLWALADLAFHVTDRETADTALAEARAIVDELPRRWPPPLRAIGALAVLARSDVTRGGRAAGSPRRVGRALLHRLSGF